MSALGPETRKGVDSYWSTFFGCPIPMMRPSQAVVFPHAGIGDYAGIYAMAFEGGCPIASVPPAALETARIVARDWSTDSIRNPAAIGAALGGEAGLAVGPAVVGYCDLGTFRPTRSSEGIRPLLPSEPHDVVAVNELRQACSSGDWDAGGSMLNADVAIGLVLSLVLVALAGYELWGERLAHIAVVTHPAHRGRGYARAVVGRLAAHILERGLIPQYRTLESNTPSVRVGAGLGFIPFATSMAVRVRTQTTRGASSRD
jgi:GNAT superfamily N-acetyltransferase